MVTNTNPSIPLHMHSGFTELAPVQLQPDDLACAMKTCNMLQDSDLPLLAATDDEKEQWETMLFCKVFANYFQDEHTLSSELKKLWKVDDSFTVKHIKSGVFMLHIMDPLLSNFLLEHSPWCVKGLCMGVRKWQQGIKPQDMDFSKENFWVQICNLPLECINERIGANLGKSLGMVRSTDKEVYFGDLGPFMRVRLELNTREPLPLGIKVRKSFGDPELLPIKIEQFGLFCFKCGRLGHNGFNCLLGPAFNPRVVDNRKRRYSIGLKGSTPKHKYPKFISSSESPIFSSLEIPGTCTSPSSKFSSALPTESVSQCQSHDEGHAKGKESENVSIGDTPTTLAKEENMDQQRRRLNSLG